MTQDGVERLTGALQARFTPDEAGHLARLLQQGSSSDSIVYSEIDVPDDWKDDIILIAYEERLLLPMRSRRGSAWEDRILEFSEREIYHMPRVVLYLVAEAMATGLWNPSAAAARAMDEAGEEQVAEMVDYVSRLVALAPKYQLEAGLMQAAGNELNIEMDMHDSIDRLVRCGIISPCTQRSLHTGFSKYEMNPSLYWSCE